LHQVKESLKLEGILRAEIEIEGRYHNLSSAESPEFKNFYENIDPSDDLETANDNVEAANNNFAVPQAANDNMPEEDKLAA
jgi:hypothetical protein